MEARIFVPNGIVFVLDASNGEGISPHRELGTLFGIDYQQEQELYGCFPEFASYITRRQVHKYVDLLQQVTRTHVHDIVHTLPRQWVPQDNKRDQMVTFLTARAAFVSQHVETGWGVSATGKLNWTFEVAE